MGLEEYIHQQRVGLGPIEVDLVVLGGAPLGAAFQPTQGALAGQGLTVVAMRLQLAGQHGQGRVLAKFVVVVEVFISQRQTEDALAQQGLQPVFDKTRIAPIGEAGGEPPDQAQAVIELPEQQGPGVGGDRAAVERSRHLLALDRFKLEQLHATVCRHRGRASNRITLCRD